MIDCHCHFNLLDDLEAIEKAQSSGYEKGLRAWILGGYSPDDWALQLQAGKTLSNVHPCLGLHPWVAQTMSREEISACLLSLEKQISDFPFLGETGLDKVKVKSHEDWNRQVHAFSLSLSLARKYHKPIVLHVVKAHEPVLKMLKHISPVWQGLVHGFNANAEVAQRYIDLGLKVSFGPQVMAASLSQRLSETLKSLNLTQILFETDSPEATGQPYCPDMLLDILKKVSTLRSENPELLRQAIEENGRELLSYAYRRA